MSVMFGVINTYNNQLQILTTIGGINIIYIGKNMATIDLLLNEAPSKTALRVGDIGKKAPYCTLINDGTEAILPLPMTITSGNQMLWDQKDFTPDSIIGASVVGVASDISLAGAGKALSGAAKNASAAGATKLASGIGALTGVEDAGQLVLHKQGKAINPNREMTFNGIGFRSFALEFHLIPIDKAQADGILAFIKFFQTHSSFELAGNNNAYYSYPVEWVIEFKKGNDEIHLPKIMPCHLTDYTIDYAGAGKMAFHEGGYPVQTNISLTFVEASLHTRDKAETYTG